MKPAQGRGANAATKEGAARPQQQRTKVPAGAAGQSVGAVGQQQRGAMAISKHSRSEGEAVFDRLKALDKQEGGANLDVIGAKGLKQLFDDLGVAEGTLEAYVLLWRLGATRNRCISRAEWLVAAYTHSIDQVGQLRAKLTDWVASVKENGEGHYEVMYNFLYDYIRGERDRQMSPENAAAAWSVLIFDVPPKILESWNKWVVSEYRRPISRDLWQQALIFLSTAECHIPDGPLHDMTKWPSAIDDYVAWRNAQLKDAG